MTEIQQLIELKNAGGSWHGDLVFLQELTINGFTGCLLKHPKKDLYCVAEFYTNADNLTESAGAIYSQSVGITPEEFEGYCKLSEEGWSDLP